MRKNFVIKYGYRWNNAENVHVCCTEDEVETVAWAIYRGNWDMSKLGFCCILNEDGSLYCRIADCM